MMIKLLMLCHLFYNIILGHENPSNTIVAINSGQVRGFTDTTTDGKPYYVFHGIPFAKPPINSLRFKPTEPVEPWSGVLDGTQRGSDCPQPNRMTKTLIGSEDCLHLSVYTTQLGEVDKLLPVMVWIHGGGFVVGSGELPAAGVADFLVNPVVLVSINYRLGALGFLSTEDENAYGNYGMLDQVMALKWVQQNILKFGGDPDKVTIFGVSAGAGSVSHHMLSPLSKGLFHKAIAQSGSSLNHWAVIEHPLDYTKKLAKLLECPNLDDSKDMMQCLSVKSLDELVIKAEKLKQSLLYPLELSPTIDVPGGSGFLLEDPLILLKEGRVENKVPLIMGITADEGYNIHFGLLLTSKFRGQKYFDKQFPEHLPLFTSIQPNMTLAIKEIAKNYYYDRSDLDDKEVFQEVLTRIFGDAMFAAGVSKTVELFSKAGIPTFAYILNHQVEDCLAILFGGECGKYCSHGDDYALQFKLNLTKKSISAENEEMQQILNKLWSSFANDRNLDIGSGVSWPSYDPANPSYVELTLPPKIRNSPLSDKTKLWTETLPNLAHKTNLKVEL